MIRGEAEGESGADGNDDEESCRSPHGSDDAFLRCIPWGGAREYPDLCGIPVFA